MYESPLKILLIDDDEDEFVITRDLLSEIEGANFDLEWVSTYHEAVDAVRQNRFDVYLLDYRLGEYTGLDLLREINSGDCSAPVIFLTGQGDRAIDIKAMEAGAADYLDKGGLNASSLERSIRYAVERYRLQANLRASELRLSTIIANNADGLVIVSKTGKMLFLNAAAVSLFGCCENDLIQQSFGYPLEVGKDAEIEIDRGNGKTVIAGMRVAEINWEDEGVYLVSLRDITEKKMLQDQLIRSERLAATGQLAASIAHEINSPLQGITSLLSIISKQYRSDPVLSEYIELIKGAFHSIRDTVKHLLDLNRPGKIKKQPLNVNDVIQDTAALYRSYLSKKKVKVNLNLVKSLPYVLASPQQISQIFMNLINNAVEAMTGKIQTADNQENGPSTEKEIKIKTRIRDNRVVIEVADTGPGFSQNDLQYIFDPFYTRKKTMGMGVGLSICYGIIEDHDGSIVAENLPGKGALFRISLPVAFLED